MRSKSFLFIALILGLALLLSVAACGGKKEPAQSGDTGSGTTQPADNPTNVPPTAVPTPVPTAVPTAEPTVAPTAAVEENFESGAITKPANLDSFQSDIKMTWQGVLSDGSPIEGTWTMSMQFVREPSAQKIVMSGDFPGADYLQGEAGDTGQALEIYVVGDTTYMNLFGTWMQMPADESQFNVEDMAFSTSDELLTDLEDANYKGTETINGVKCKKYTFDESALKAGDFGEGSTIDKAEGTIYIAEEGNYMVHMDVTMTGTAFEMPTGTLDEPVDEGSFEMIMDLSRINEPIEITVPEEALKSGGAPEDLPLPEDATDLTSLGTMMTFSTAVSPADLATWYKEQMPANGWALKSDNTMGDLYMFDYTKDTRTASFMISTDTDSGKTSVLITISEE